MTEKLKVAFACIENSNRSQMAEAFARLLATQTIEAFSAGSRPSGKVNPKAIEAMKTYNYDLSQHRSKSLEELPKEELDILITMGCGEECPWVLTRHRMDWQIPDPKDLKGDAYGEVREIIKGKVEDLIAHLDDYKK
jgi:protein-tyrosine-phosphatase